MIINGRAIAEEIQQHLRSVVQNNGPRTLVAVAVGADAVTNQYIGIKRRFAESIGATFELYDFPDTTQEVAVFGTVQALGANPEVHGIIVQLPIPRLFNTEELLAHIPPHKDVDALGPHTAFLSPVVLAVQEILARSNISVEGKKTVVVGHGRLVGKPIAAWFRTAGSTVTVADKDTEKLAELTRDADIVVCGAGSPHLVTPEMVQDGVVLIDAGTSESQGVVVGDIDPACAEKAVLYTPVPGGVGPITVAMLFKNLYRGGSF